MKFVIINLDDRTEFWSNMIGWTSISTADEFDHEELVKVNLPMQGAWVPAPLVDLELPSYGMFTPEGGAIVGNLIQEMTPDVGEGWWDFWDRFKKATIERGREAGIDTGEIGDTACREEVMDHYEDRGVWAAKRNGEMVWVG
jgi:hypothetical protein